MPFSFSSSIFYRPSTDWVQDTAAATTKWGDIGDWDVSGVADFSFAFSKHRDATGGTSVTNGNPKAAFFVGTAMSKWTTTSATTLDTMFGGAKAMNSDLSKWITTSVTSLQRTFQAAAAMNSDLSTWITTSVTSLKRTFVGAGEMNSDLSGWNVAKVTTLEETFASASKYTGTGLPTWNIAKVTNMADTFLDATFLTSCAKRQIIDAWKSNVVSSAYVIEWATDACPPLTDATFKQASWGT